jgi:hypothetical protein
MILLHKQVDDITALTRRMSIKSLIEICSGFRGKVLQTFPPETTANPKQPITTIVTKKEINHEQK